MKKKIKRIGECYGTFSDGDFRSRLLAFQWANVEPLPPHPLRAGSRLSRFPTGVE